MTAQPKLAEFLPNGEVRTADVLRSAGDEIDRILNDAGLWDQHTANMFKAVPRFRSLATRLRRLAETVERG